MRSYSLLTLFFGALFFLSCNDGQEDKKSPDSLVDSTGSVKSDTAVSQIFAGRPISFYLAHPQIPLIAKDLYLNKVPLSADENVLGIVDSIFTANVETAPFYFLTITRTMEKSDGAYSEVLGMTAKEYVETNTSEFINYFLNEPLLTDKNFEEWARCVAGEIMIAMEDKEMTEANKVTNVMKSNCTDCSAEARQKLEDFSARVKSYIEQPR